MAWIDPRAEEHLRRRFTRPDGQRYLRHDAHRFDPPRPVQRKSYAARVIEEREAKEKRAALDHELKAFYAEHLELRRQLAEVKFELAFRRIVHKFRADQPRVPKGEPEGGQWTKEGGGDAGRADGLASAPAAMRRPEQATDLSAARRGGHHYLPQGVYTKRRLPDETRKVFEEATTGPLQDKRLNTFSRGHRDYNEAVDQLFDQFLRKKGLTEEQMTPDHARQLLGEVITSGGLSNSKVQSTNLDASNLPRRAVQGQ
jgi:hypothetical protein